MSTSRTAGVGGTEPSAPPLSETTAPVDREPTTEPEPEPQPTMFDAAEDLQQEAIHRVTTRLSRTPAHMAPPVPGDDLVLDGLVERVTLRMEVTRAAIERMVTLCKTLQSVQADEIADWTVPVRVHVVADDDAPVPPVIGVSCTVFADGEVHLAVYFDGMDRPLWCLVAVDLAALTPL